MKKILSISIIILVLLISCFLIYNHNVKQHYVDIQKKRIELFLKYNLEDFNLKKVTITKTYKSPTGSYAVDGYLNSDDSLAFTAYFSSSSNYQFDGQITFTDKLDKYTLQSDKPINIDTIFNKKNIDKKHYEAKPPMFISL